MISFIKYFLMFLLILFLQRFVLDQVPQLIPYSKLTLFFVFLIALPTMSTVWVMVIGFFGGLIFDIFYGTPGINAAACVLLGFVKEPLMKLFKNDEDNVEYSAHITYLGFGRFFFYAIVMAFLFHLIAEFLSVFSVDQFGQTLIRVVVNTILSVILIYIYEIIFFYRKVAA
jgi:cell shape-determining protein MreD